MKDVIKDYTFDKFVASEDWQRRLKQTAVEYSEKPDSWFYISGQSGAGKTHICTSICRKLLLDGHKVYFLQWRDFLPKIQAAKYDSDKREAILKPCKETEYLYIDDLFKTAMSQKIELPRDEVMTCFEILNFRQNANLKTIVSSELTLEQLDSIDTAIAGRLVENAGKNVFTIDRDRAKNYRYRNVMVV